jgi:hypothetical protein
VRSFIAIQFGHLYIHQNNVDIIGVGLQPINGLMSIFNHKHMGSLLRKNAIGNLAIDFAIIDDQYPDAC